MFIDLCFVKYFNRHFSSKTIIFRNILHSISSVSKSSNTTMNNERGNFLQYTILNVHAYIEKDVIEYLRHICSLYNVFKTITSEELSVDKISRWIYENSIINYSFSNRMTTYTFFLFITWL